MVNENALVVYKNKPALVKEVSDGKISISLQDGTKVKVRDKDIELIHPGVAKNFDGINDGGILIPAVRETWELLLADNETPVSIKELAELIFGGYSPSSAWSVFCLLKDGLYFSGSTNAIFPRNMEEVTAEETRRGEKERETGERASFLERIKSNHLLPEDGRYLQDVEALAFGKSAKSRTMKDLNLGETPEDAHALLLKTGFWTNAVNPHPSRFGLSLCDADVCPDKPPAEENRCDLTDLAAFAIDSPWSSDPDDAVSIGSSADGRHILYVHIADPAASVVPDSPQEKEARNRGATLYLPETTVRMLAEESIPMFALDGISPALTFQITIDENGEIAGTEIFPSVVKVRRMTYEEADREMEDIPELRAINELAQRNLSLRVQNGAVNIELPEIHIAVEEGNVKIDPILPYKSAALVRECMLVAGEASGAWAAGNGLAFPYIIQEVELNGNIPSGMAGSYQLRRCMRPRILSTKPGRHQGLGLASYTQVTSPLRRYTDLLSHMQIRAFLRGGKPLSSDEVMERLGAGEAAASAAVHAERASRNHWTMVYLDGKKDSVWDAVALEKKGNRWAVIIPSLALETQVHLQNDISPNETVRLVLKSVNIPRGEAVFVK